MTFNQEPIKIGRSKQAYLKQDLVDKMQTQKASTMLP